MSKQPTATWLDVPEDHDYAAAISYLSLIYPSQQATKIAQRLQAVPISQFKAKDILRASQLPLLDEHNDHVQKDLAKIDNNKALSPILLVQDSGNGKVIIADGYHRVCAIYSQDEDMLISCQITGLVS